MLVRGAVRPPREIYPAFYGCYDWHSAVHGHWMLVRLLRRHPGLPIEAEIRAALVAGGGPRSIVEPATVTDRTDPQLVHLDGLNISRAWCMRGIAAALPAADPARGVLEAAAACHAAAGLPHVTSGDYAGEHWLASFATYLLTTAL